MVTRKYLTFLKGVFFLQINTRMEVDSTLSYTNFEIQGSGMQDIKLTVLLNMLINNTSCLESHDFTEW